jgi:transposase
MTTDTRIISHKLSLLKLAQSINNISKACRDSFVSRTTFYEYKHRFETYGLSGLEDKPKKVPKMPNETKKEIVEKVLELSRRYPSYGASRIACELEGIVCSATVHNILKRHGLSKKIDRLLAMVSIPEDINLSPLILRKLEMAKPSRIEANRAGELISVDTFYVGCLKGIVGSIR